MSFPGLEKLYSQGLQFMPGQGVGVGFGGIGVGVGLGAMGVGCIVGRGVGSGAFVAIGLDIACEALCVGGVDVTVVPTGL